MIKDMMEMAMMIWPKENGSFPHLSGLTFSVNTAIPSSVVLNEQEEFIGVSGEYRVYDIKVFNRETEKYEPIDLTKVYTLAATNFILLECGSGMKMLEDAVIVQNDGMLDVEALERYITEVLGGTVGERYAETEINITFTDGFIGNEDNSGNEDNNGNEGNGGSGENNADSGNGADGDENNSESSNIVIVIVCIALFGVIILFAFIARRKIFERRD